MSRLYILALAASVSPCCNGQWMPAGIPTLTGDMSSIYADTATNSLLFCGETSLNGDFNFNDQTVSIWHQGEWSTLGSFLNRPFCVVRHGDTLFVGGAFPGGNSLAVAYLQCYTNGSWSSCGDFDEMVYRFKVIDGELYALGAFDVVDGQSCQGIAKRMNGEWVPVGHFNVIDPPYIQDLFAWNGTLYVTGGIRYGSPNPKDIAYLSESGEWLALGAGIQGGFGYGRSLAVYNDALYVGGAIQVNAGNAGHGIMRWDGQQFHPVGTGFQGLDGTTNGYGGALELEVYDDKLWACGTFSYAGNVPARIATWDGVQWCGLPAGPVQEINTIEFFHDTLFASCHGNLNGEPVNCAVRFVGDVYSDTCSMAVGLGQRAVLPRSTLRAYRVGDGQVEVSGLPQGKHHVEVFDDAGRLVFTTSVTVTTDRPCSFAMPPLSGGMHLIRLGASSVRFLGP